MPSAPPRIPRLGAAASGLVSLLLVGAFFAIPLLGMLIAPLGLMPVLHFQARGESGARAWGPVVLLTGIASISGISDFLLPLLALYVLLIVIPAAGIEAWQRYQLSEGQWVAATILVATIGSLLTVALIALPETPIAATERWWNEGMNAAGEMYAAAGVPESDLENILIAIEQMKPLTAMIVPVVPIAYLIIVLFWIRPRLPLLGLRVESPPFEEYRNDDWLAAVLAAAGIGTLALGGTGRWVAANLLVAVLILYFVQGLAMIRAHLARWFGRGWLVRWGVALLCLQGPMLPLVAMLGIADSFHSLRPRPNDDGGIE